LFQLIFAKHHELRFINTGPDFLSYATAIWQVPERGACQQHYSALHTVDSEISVFRLHCRHKYITSFIM